MEEWKGVVGYEDYYEVSSLGRVRSKDRVFYHPAGHCGRKFQKGRVLTESISWDGYAYVMLSVQGKRKRCRVNRLVAIAFLDNPDELPVVNHIDEDRLNNCVDNLEWCTHGHNSNHGNCRRNISIGRRKPVVSIDKDGNRTWYDSGKSAEAFGFSRTKITACAKGKSKTHRGLRWEYA